MLVLAIDTSSAAVIAALVEVGADGMQVVAQRDSVSPRGHSELLAPSIAACLAQVGLKLAGIGAIVAGLGPGPFTGLRVGLVTAAAMAQALDVPGYGVCSLDAIAGAHSDIATLLVATDARRHEVYWARYADGARVAGPSVDRPARVPVDGVDAVAGTGVALHDWSLPALPGPYPSAAALVRCAAERIRAGAPGEQLVPLYLRRPDAVPGVPKAVSRR